MQLTGKRKPLSRSRKILLGLLIFFLVYTITGFFVLPPVVKSVLSEKLSVALDRETRVSGVKINPYNLSARLTGLIVIDKDGKPLASVDAFYTNLEVSSLFKQALVLKAFHVQHPYFRIVRTGSDKFNVSDLLPEKNAAKEKTGESETPAPLRFSIRDIQISGGTVEFLDRFKQTDHRLNDITVSIPFVSSRPDDAGIEITPLFSAKLNGAALSVSAKSTPFAGSQKADVTLDVKRLDLPRYLPYASVPETVRISSAFLDSAVRLSYERKNEKDPWLSVSGRTVLSKLEVFEDTGDALLKLPALQVVLTSAEPLSQRFHFSGIVAESPEVNIRKLKSGEFNLSKLIPQTGTAKSEENIPDKNPGTGNPPLVVVDRLEIGGGKILFFDQSLAHPGDTSPNPITVTLDQIALTVENLSTQENAQANTALSMRWNQKGTLSVTGPVTVQPLSSDLRVEASNIDIRPAEPYITDIARVNIVDGNVTARGRLNFSFTESDGPKLRYRGELALRSVASVGTSSGNDFVKWDSLDFSGMDIRSNPVTIDIDAVALTGYYTRLLINPDGTINVNRIFQRTAPAKKPAQKPPLPEININTVTLQNGTIHFVDRFTTPNFETDLMKLGGRISGLSTDAPSRADVSLKGIHQSSAPLEISGKFNPLAESPFVDMKLDIRNIQLSPFSPYSGKYIGYVIEKGSLHLELDYRLENRKLHGENRIFVDQLTLGDKVDSPDATSLPVRLGISLLQDRNGRIALDLPVDGDIRNPQFNVGKAVTKMIGNLFAKIITAPFAAIGSMFGGGKELSFIEFDSGSPQLTDTATKKLDTLITALYERPKIRLDITGAADPVADRDALRDLELESRLKAEKLKKISKKERETLSSHPVALSPEEYDRYLTEIYEDADFPKPRDEKGRIKKLPPEEMKKLLDADIQITDDALRLLAQQRAFAVQAYILKGEKVKPERIFVLEPESFASPKNADSLKRRVNFTLK